MKKITGLLLLITTLVLVIISITHSTAQTIRVVDNNFNAPTGSNVYATLQEAVDAATAGDIIHVQPSPTTYGNVSIDKQLTVKGIGFNLDKDIPLQSNIGAVTFTNNIDNTSDASGSIITGLTTGAINLGLATGPAFTLQNVTIDNCLFQYIANFTGSTYMPLDNIEIRNSQNYSGVSISGIGSVAIYLAKQVTNSLIRNNALGVVVFDSTTPGTNIITNNIMYGYVRVDAEGTNTTIVNNDFISASGSNRAFGAVLRDCIVANNIFYGRTPSNVTGGASTDANFQRNTFTNNLSFSTGDDMLPPAGGGVGNSGTGNIEAQSPLFQNVPLLDTWDASYDFTLTGGSPALSAGSDGTDIGISGGAYPFSGNFVFTTTAFPVIQILNTSTIINPGDNLNVRIKASGN